MIKNYEKLLAYDHETHKNTIIYPFLTLKNIKHQ